VRKHAAAPEAQNIMTKRGICYEDFG
jgi:hypothetical protein